jgi:hypothetical protein
MLNDNQAIHLFNIRHLKTLLVLFDNSSFCRKDFFDLLDKEMFELTY